MEILTGTMIAVLIFYSGKLIMNDQLSLNNFFSFLAAMMLAYQPVKSLATINVGISQGLSASRRILPIIDTTNLIQTNEDKINLNLENGTIDCKNINFNYSTNLENKVLKNINIKLNGGKMTALVGQSGSGKSTLLSLIPRIYDPTAGKLEIDGQDIKGVNLFSLRKEISIVDQNVTLFDDTIFNNIKYAKPDANDNEVYEAAQLSMCSEFIDKLENKYQTMIGENGVRLSGGEKQRLSIARAFLKNSKIILLDEATSSLDSETEEKIQKALDKLTLNKTTVVIAHRLSTILNSDKIYVMDKGIVMDSGNHEELLIKSDTYKNYYKKQINKS
jgi:subfamily B ATP-binding cassette protein MsbA